MGYVLPPDSRVALGSGHLTDHANIADMLALVADKNVWTYSGIDPSGATSSRTAIQNAVNDAVSSHGTVVIPPGTYKLDGPITYTDTFSFLGSGRDSTFFQLANGVNDYAFKATQGSGAITGAHFADFAIVGNAINQTAGGGISAVGAVQSSFERIHFNGVFDWGLSLQGIPGGGFGHHNRVISCLFDNAAAAGIGGGIFTTSSDENFFLADDFEYLGGVNAPAGGGSYPVAFLDSAGLQMITACCFVGARGGATNTVGIRVNNAARTRINGCTFDGQGADNIMVVGTDCAIVGNEFTSIGDQGATAGAFAGVHLEYGAVRNVVSANVFDSSATTAKTGYFVYEQNIGSSGYNNITNNVGWVRGSLATTAFTAALTGSVVTGNITH